MAKLKEAEAKAKDRQEPAAGAVLLASASGDSLPVPTRRGRKGRRGGERGRGDPGHHRGDNHATGARAAVHRPAADVPVPQALEQIVDAICVILQERISCSSWSCSWTMFSSQ